MSLKIYAKFEEKLTLGYKNDMRNLVNFNARSGKSENLHFNGLLLSKSILCLSQKNIEELCVITLKNDPNFEEKLTFCLKNDIGNLVNFNASSGKSENLHLDGLLSSKVWNASAKKI